MNKKFLSALALLVLAVGLGVIGSRLWSVDESSQTAMASDQLGECSPNRWKEYLAISTDAAPIRFGGGPLDFADGAYETFRKKVNDMALEENQTVFIGTDTETGKAYPFSCAAESCTAQEASEAEVSCLRDGGANCATMALVFKNEMYCLSYPRE